MSSKSEINIVIAITGASGSIYAKNLIEYLLSEKFTKFKLNLNLVISDTGLDVMRHEIGLDFLENINIKKYSNSDFSAPFASGSSVPNAMIVIPCSMGTLSKIANGSAENLICRSADVILKERRKLILVLRETPYNLIHIRNMETVTLAGGIILPASPSFYLIPNSIDDLIFTITSKIVDLLEIPQEIKRWGNF